MENRGNLPGPLIQVPRLLIALAVPQAIPGQTVGWGVVRSSTCVWFCSALGLQLQKVSQPRGPLLLVWVSEEAPALLHSMPVKLGSKSSP